MRMKKILLLPVSFILLSFTLLGCSDKNLDEENKKEYNIDGFITVQEDNNIVDKDVEFSGVRDVYGLSINEEGKYILKMKNIDGFLLKEKSGDFTFKEEGDILLFEFSKESFNDMYDEYNGSTDRFLNSLNQVPNFKFIYSREYNYVDFLLTLEVDSTHENLKEDIKYFIDVFNDFALTEAALNGDLVDKEIKYTVVDKDTGEDIDYQ